jgi:hypothetical protein
MKYSTKPTSFPDVQTNILADAQVFYLNQKGYILSSTNTIFSTIHLQNCPVFEWCPFLESIFPSLFEEAAEEVTQFERVTTAENFLPGIYDYTFVKLPAFLANEEVLMWIISDRTACYQRMTELQQFYNEQARAQF